MQFWKASSFRQNIYVEIIFELRKFLPDIVNVHFSDLAKRRGGWKSSIRSRSGAENFVVLYVMAVFLLYPAARMRFLLHKESSTSKSAWYGLTRSKWAVSLYLWPTCRTFFRTCSSLCTYGEHIFHFWKFWKCQRAHRKCTDWSTCAPLATNLALSSSP